MPILHHLHLPKLTTYAHASRLQERLVSRLLRHKASTRPHLLSSSPQTTPYPHSPPPPSAPPPAPPFPPTILTFTPTPIYTTGRRDSTPPSAEQLAFLSQPLRSAHGSSGGGGGGGTLQTAEFVHALRGGQITFHGPGQLVIYPIFSLAQPYSFAGGAGCPSASSGASSPAASSSASSSSSSGTGTGKKAASLTPRCYVHLLEACTISTLARYGISGQRTENPGVWVDGDTKIAALGVHLRRNVTSHGVGLNVDTDLRWFKRIVACGLEGKRVTSMREEVRKREEDGEWKEGLRDGVGDMSLEEVADLWVGEFARECGLGEGDVVRVSEEDLLAEGG